MKVTTIKRNQATAFLINTHATERQLIAVNSTLKPIYQELTGLDQSRELGGPLIISAGSRYDSVFRIISDFCQKSGGFVTLHQFLALIRLLIVREVDYAGEQALQLMEALYRFTPGGFRSKDKTFPRPTDEEGDQLRVYREVVLEEAETKTTIILSIPEGSMMMGRMLGVEHANIKALGELFVPNAGVHVWIKKLSPPADLEALLGSEPTAAKPGPAPVEEKPAAAKPKRVVKKPAVAAKPRAKKASAKAEPKAPAKRARKKPAVTAKR